MRTVYICSPYRAKGGAELDRHIEYAQQLTIKRGITLKRKLRILINANFEYGDYHLILDYVCKKGDC